MGEYATHKGKSVKIGTCEDMYYLRFTDRGNVTPEPNSLNPADPALQSELRWRFPFPAEDDIEPGQYAGPTQGQRISVTLPASAAAHENIQFTHPAGLLLSIPCPDVAKDTPTLTGSLSDGREVSTAIHRNGWQGGLYLVAQKWLPTENGAGRLVPILRCGTCGAMFRVEDDAEILTLAQAFSDEAGRLLNRHGDDRVAADYLEIARRILRAAGLTVLA